MIFANCKLQAAKAFWGILPKVVIAFKLSVFEDNWDEFQLKQVRGLDRRRPSFLLQPNNAAFCVGETHGPEEPRGSQEDHWGPTSQA